MRPLLELWIISLVCLPIFGGEPGVHPLLVENPSQNLIRSKRMAGGTEVESAEDVPYQASIRLLDPDRHLASGAILNFRFVVTQASFIVKLYRVYPGQELPALARVRLGQVELQSSVNDQFQEIGSYVIHPNFSFIEARHDVALLKTVGVITFNQRVQPIVLRKGPIQDNTYVQYTDWGADTEYAMPENYKPRLQRINAIAISNGRCSELLETLSLGNIISESRVCIYTNGEGSVCTGNAGGPLVVFENGQPQLVAVMNFAYLACNASYPGGFERLWNHNRWIVESASIDFKYANFEKMCRLTRNVAAQMLANQQRTVRSRIVARDSL